MAFISTETAINGFVPVVSPELPPDPYPVTIISPGGNDYEYMRRYTTLNDPSDILDLVVRRLYVTDYEIIGGAVDGSNLLAGIGTYSSVRLQVYGSEYVSEAVYIGGFYESASSCPVDTENLALYAGGDAVVASNLSVDGDCCIGGNLTIIGAEGGGDEGSASFGGNVSFSGITTANVLDIDVANITNLTSTRSTFTGISTFNSTSNFNATSTFTNGAVLVGSGTSTGTPSQPLQVFGGTYISGNVGVATLNPKTKLHVVGDSIITGISTIGLSTVATAPENVQLSFELASNTSLRIRVRGTDGVLRSATIALS